MEVLIWTYILSLQFVSQSSRPLTSYLRNRSTVWKTTFTKDSVPFGIPQQHCYCCPERASVRPWHSPSSNCSTMVEGGWNLVGAVISGELSHNPMKWDWEEKRNWEVGINIVLSDQIPLTILGKLVGSWVARVWDPNGIGGTRASKIWITATGQL